MFQHTGELRWIEYFKDCGSIWPMRHLIENATKSNIPQSLSFVGSLFYSLLGQPLTWVDKPYPDDFWQQETLELFQQDANWEPIKAIVDFDKVNAMIIAMQLADRLYRKYDFYSNFNGFDLSIYDNVEFAISSGLHQQAEELKQEADEALEQLGINLDRINIAVKETLAQVKARAEQDLILPASRGYLPDLPKSPGFAGEVEKFYGLSDSKVRKVIELLGFLQTGMGQKRKLTTDRQVSGITYGNNLSAILPKEYLKNRYQFGADFAERKLMQYKHGEQRGQAGDFFLLFDWSASMSQDLCGATRKQWGIAVAIKLYEICKKQNRRIWLIPFLDTVIDGNNARWAKFNCYLQNTKCLILDKNTSLKDVIDLMKSAEYIQGNTNWEPPLERAIAEIEKHGKKDSNGRWRHSDVLYITDAEDYKVNDAFTNKVKKFKKQYNCKVDVILVSQKKEVEEQLTATISDKVINIASLQDKSKVASEVGGLLLDYE